MAADGAARGWLGIGTPKQNEPKAEDVAFASRQQTVASEPEFAPYGETALGLTRFGDRWIKLSNLESVDFEPADGCGAEVFLTCDTVMHLNTAEANALKRYLNEEAAIGIFARKEDSRGNTT
jgi:hypothetical protein